MADILIVEDDDTLRMTLADNLTEEGYGVREAADVATAKATVLEQAPDLILLDIMLPDGDGYSLCGALRAEGFAGMIMMLTARTLEDDLVKGFDAGADDYLKKPYQLTELLVRVRALLRRAGATVMPGAAVLPELKGHSVDLDGHRVLDAEGGEVPLTRTEFDLLQYFRQHAGRALTRNEILDEVWGQDVIVDARTVDNFVSSLKKKLGWTSDVNWSIKTIRGVGYRFEPQSR